MLREARIDASGGLDHIIIAGNRAQKDFSGGERIADDSNFELLEEQNIIKQ